LSPEAWTPAAGGGALVVKQAVEHGATVSKGDLLIALDLEKMDQVIRDLESERTLNEIALKLAEEELPILERSTPADLAAAERAKKIADEDLKKFLEVERDFSEKSANFNVRRAKEYLEYAKEELRQLEKMYKSKDLTEETEEIILKRQRNTVEMAEWSVKVAEKSRDDLLKTDLPRRDQAFQESAQKQTLALEKARATLPLTLNQKRLSLAKLKYDREKALDRLAKLKRDRELLTVKAPSDGIVYYGKCVRGQWTTAATVAPRLQRGGILMPEEVLITIVKPQSLFVRAVVEEKDLQHLRPGMIGKVAPATRPNARLTAKVQSSTAPPSS
jgi:multidrug resistance efflux pump